MNNRTTATTAGISALIAQLLVSWGLDPDTSVIVTGALVALGTFGLSFLLPGDGAARTISINKVFGVALIGLLAGAAAANLTGCSAMLGKLGVTQADCTAYDFASHRHLEAYAQKCIEAPSPNDDNCLKADALRLASVLCRQAAAAGDSEKNEAAAEAFDALGVEPVEPAAQ
jgi:hypothetical protein